MAGDSNNGNPIVDEETRRQIVEKHATGANLDELSIEFGLTQRFLVRLLREEPSRKLIADLRAVSWSAFTGQAAATVAKALAKLAELIDSDDPRIAASASRALADIASKLEVLREFDSRLAAIEEQLGVGKDRLSPPRARV
jgi:hypothetical protein